MLCSSVFLCVDGVLCFAGVSLAIQVSTAPHPSPSHNFLSCLGGRALRAAWWAHVPRVTHTFDAHCALAIVKHCDACICRCAVLSLLTSSICTDASSERALLFLHLPARCLCAVAHDASACPGPCSWPAASCYACACDLSVRLPDRTLLTAAAAADLNRASTSRPLFHPPVFVKPFLDRESEFSLSTPFLSPTSAVLCLLPSVCSTRLIATRRL